ncbi:MAG: zinc-ribbon domain-containing protein [Deltaproteobacteria bacterium]|nr:zinc-ribbon domain-containing protein [Deltaproteobacteria bacterium]
MTPNFCTKCGNSLQAQDHYCSQCGTPVGAEAIDNPQTEHPSALKSNVAALLCYALGFISGIIFLNLDPYRKMPEIRFHAWQSILFCVAWFVISLIDKAVVFTFFYFWPVSWLIKLALLAVWLILLVKAYNGEKLRLPIIGDIAEQKAAQ